MDRAPNRYNPYPPPYRPASPPRFTFFLPTSRTPETSVHDPPGRGACDSPGISPNPLPPPASSLTGSQCPLPQPAPSTPVGPAAFRASLLHAPAVSFNLQVQQSPNPPGILLPAGFATRLRRAFERQSPPQPAHSRRPAVADTPVPVDLCPRFARRNRPPATGKSEWMS